MNKTPRIFPFSVLPTFDAIASFGACVYFLSICICSMYKLGIMWILSGIRYLKSSNRLLSWVLSNVFYCAGWFLSTVYCISLRLRRQLRCFCFNYHYHVTVFLLKFDLFTKYLIFNILFSNVCIKIKNTSHTYTLHHIVVTVKKRLSLKKMLKC